METISMPSTGMKALNCCNYREKYPDNLQLYPGDISDENSIRQSLHKIAGQVGALDILLNNAAVHLEQSRPLLEQVDFSVYLPTYQANVIGPLMVIKYALPLLRKGQKKLIVNFSSEAGSIGACERHERVFLLHVKGCASIWPARSCRTP